MPVSIGELTGYVGKGIADICSNGFADPHQNHCAHFVSHALGIKLGMLCGDMKHSTKHSGASLRVDEVFNQLSRRGTWENVPPNSDGALIFVISAKAVHGNRMINIPQKHVGIFHGGRVFNFSNTHHKVVADPTVEAFHGKFRNLYHGGDISLFYGLVP